jgi:hypothetical protein
MLSSLTVSHTFICLYYCNTLYCDRFIDPGRIQVADGEAEVELACREDFEYVIKKLDDTLQNGR